MAMLVTSSWVRSWHRRAEMGRAGWAGRRDGWGENRVFERFAGFLERFSSIKSQVGYDRTKSDLLSKHLISSQQPRGYKDTTWRVLVPSCRFNTCHLQHRPPQTEDSSAAPCSAHVLRARIGGDLPVAAVPHTGAAWVGVGGVVGRFGWDKEAVWRKPRSSHG